MIIHRALNDMRVVSAAHVVTHRVRDNPTIFNRWTVEPVALNRGPYPNRLRKNEEGRSSKGTTINKNSLTRKLWRAVVDGTAPGAAWQAFPLIGSASSRLE